MIILFCLEPRCCRQKPEGWSTVVNQVPMRADVLREVEYPTLNGHVGVEGNVGSCPQTTDSSRGRRADSSKRESGKRRGSKTTLSFGSWIAYMAIEPLRRYPLLLHLKPCVLGKNCSQRAANMRTVGSRLRAYTSQDCFLTKPLASDTQQALFLQQQSFPNMRQFFLIARTRFRSRES